MTYTDYNTIPYPYLHDAGLILSKKYSLESIYMDNQGGICLELKGLLNTDAVKDILKNITPWDTTDADYDITCLDYSYSHDMQHTHVYSRDGIDYRKL